MPSSMAHVYGRNYIKKRLRSGGSGKGKLSDLYVVFFRSYGIMPDVLDRQNPKAVFDLLEGLSEGNNQDKEYTGNDPYLRMFYGQ